MNTSNRNHWQYCLHMALAAVLVAISSFYPILTVQAASFLYVATSGNDDNDCLAAITPCRTVSAAIRKASDGDTIRVADGLYAENLSIDKSITISGAGNSTTYIDGAKHDRVIHVLSGQNVNLIGVTIQNGFLSGQHSGGGGISNEGTLIISGSIIQNNEVVNLYY